MDTTRFPLTDLIRDRLNYYTKPLTQEPRRLPVARVQVLTTKFTPGGESVAGTLDLDEMLLERYPADAHFMMYTSPQGVRLVKGTAAYLGVCFEIAAVDLDFDQHRSRPTLSDFCDLAMVADVTLRPAPNVIYQTRGGARLVYLIETIQDDPDLFERHYQGLIARVKRQVNNLSNFPYHVDTAAKDWTRLFRCPRVTRDGREEFDHHVQVVHDRRVSLLNLKIPKGRRRKMLKVGAGCRQYHGTDRYLIRLLGEMLHEGQRNFPAQWDPKLGIHVT